MRSLTVIETHPVQYHAPVYRAVQERFGIPVTAIYGSDFSVSGYYDREFARAFAWDADLLSGYRSVFLSRIAAGGGRSFEDVSTRGLDRALKGADPGPVLLLGYSPRFHQAAFLHAWRSRRPLLLRAETADNAGDRGVLQSAVRDQALRLFYGACAKLLYVGRQSEQHFRRIGIASDKLLFSPYCVDTTPFSVDEASRHLLRQTAREALGAGPDRTVLLFSGKLSHRKGVDLIIAATRALPADARERVLIAFLGSGELQADLERAAAAAPAVEVRFCGFRNQTELSPYYHAADLLVLPSRHSEAWGLVVNEALHHGLPSVLSRAVGCAPDLIEPGVTGELAETDSIESLAQAIVRALPLVDRIEIRDSCRDRVSGYTVAKAAEGIAQAYRAVVN